MDIKRAETKLILMQVALDAWDMFKKIVWAICAIAAVAVVGLGVNWLFALALFVGVALVTGIAALMAPARAISPWMESKSLWACL